VGRIERGGRERMDREGRRRKGTEKKGKGRRYGGVVFCPLQKFLRARMLSGHIFCPEIVRAFEIFAVF